MNTESTVFAGQLLIAMPNLADPNFWHTVVLLGVHSREEGAFGLVINRPLEVDMRTVLQDLGEDPSGGPFPEVLGGGPVEPTHGFVISDRPDLLDDEDLLPVADDIGISGSTDVLLALTRGRIQARYHLVLGYSGWAPGQLEREIEENSWLVAPASHRIIFETPFPERWNAALASIGVDPGTIVDLGSASPS